MMITVLMPFRDAAATIVAAVRSVLEQRDVELELIAVNDGSRDGSAKVLAEVGDSRLTIVDNESSPGIVGALETGRARVKSSWIARMDADDLAHPDRLALQLARAEEGDRPDVVGCGVRLINPCGEGMVRYVEWVNGLTDAAAISRSRFIECPLIHPSVIIRAEALDEVGGYRDAIWAEDHGLWLRMLESGCRLVKRPEVLLDWRDSPRRLTREDSRYGDEARMAMRCFHLARLPAVAKEGVSIAGAGPIGKQLARGLQEQGVAVHGFFEVNSRRIGERIHGAPVMASEEVGTRWRESVLLGAVGVPGGRERVRRIAVDSGRVEGEDFWSIC